MSEYVWASMQLLAVALVTAIYPWRFKSLISRVLVHVPVLLLLFVPRYLGLARGLGVRYDYAINSVLVVGTATCYLLKLRRLVNERSERQNPAA